MSLTFAQISEHAISLGASDIHLSPDMPPMVRIDGILKEIRVATQTASDIKSLLSSIMTTEQQEALGRDLELNFIYEDPNHIRYRVSIFTANGNPAATLRIIPNKLPTLSALDSPHAIKSLASSASGLVIITGALGSGKSTTLAAMIDYINKNSSKHIITVEDPIEFIHKSDKSLISQRSVGLDTKSYAAALMSSFSEDPDIIFIDELKNQESARLALTAANSGCLVLTSMNASSATNAITALLDSFANDEEINVSSLLSNSLVGIVTQRLIPKATGNGRVAAYEIMPATPAIKTLISENKLSQIQPSIKSGSLEGAVAMEDYIQKLILCGSIREDNRFNTSGAVNSSINADDGEF